MSMLSRLPKETLLEIVSYISIAEVAGLTTVCRDLEEVATKVLYTHIDLSRSEREHQNAVHDKTDRRQRRLIESLAENPSLGGLVKTWRNYGAVPNRQLEDATSDGRVDRLTLVEAARNMTSLHIASFTANHISSHVIANLPSYTQLTDLTIIGLHPGEHIWSVAPAALRKLSWQVPQGWISDAVNPWKTAQLLINVVETTCPNLERLDISFGHSIVGNGNTPKIDPRLLAQYRGTTTPKLSNLKHFGLKYRQNQQPREVEKSILELVDKYKDTLASVILPIPKSPNQNCTAENLSFILKVCMPLRNLRELSIATSQTYKGSVSQAMDWFYALTSALASPKYEIEKFEIGCLQVPFSGKIGQLFGTWKSLRHLRCGDGENKGGPVDVEHKLRFDKYRPEILEFIQSLSPRMEELYLEINGQNISCDHDDDHFNAMATLSKPVFTLLPLLHTFDIHAWVANEDGGQDSIPEKCMFYRRLPAASEDQTKVKEIFVSRVDCIYRKQDFYVELKKELVTAQETKPFSGRDAGGIWGNGFEFKEKSRPRSSNGRRGRVKKTETKKNDVDYTWPSYRDEVGWYEGYRAHNFRTERSRTAPPLREPG